jgi:transcriptional regulator with XRE-family HTH domain
MTLDEYRIECQWTQAELARRSRVDVNTIRRALAGDMVSANTANKIAVAFSKELGRTIRANQIEGLKFNL